MGWARPEFDSSEPTSTPISFWPGRACALPASTSKSTGSHRRASPCNAGEGSNASAPRPATVLTAPLDETGEPRTVPESFLQQTPADLDSHGYGAATSRVLFLVRWDVAAVDKPLDPTLLT
jgi:hypothetical protein